LPKAGVGYSPLKKLHAKISNERPMEKVIIGRFVNDIFYNHLNMT
jgi:hypothetical protein